LDIVTTHLLETAEVDIAYDVRGPLRGFMGGEFGYAGQPEAFARKLRDVLDDQT
jgi:hypothetical protein